MTESSVGRLGRTGRPVLPLWAALIVAAGAGPVMDGAYPDLGWWPLALPALACLLLALIGRGVWGGALVGAVYGFAFYLPHIVWASAWVGPLPWIALAGAMAASHAVGGGLIALAYRRWQGGGLSERLLVLPLAVAGLYTAREALISIWPYGGFAWGRLGHAFVDSPFSQLYAWVGISGMSFLVVWLVALTIEAARLPRLDRPQRVAAPVGLALALVAWPTWPTPTTGELSVAVVQGNGPAGYFDDRDPGDLLAAQLAATQPLYGQVDVDVVLWPEGSSDWDPAVSPTAAAVWDAVVQQMDAPLIAQSVTGGDGVYYNSIQLWQDGELDQYDKRHPVVWGEYIPDRAFFELIVPDLTQMIGREYQFGTTDAVMDIPVSDAGSAAFGWIRAAVNICYDIVDDRLLRESILDGGRVILSSSNNADFGRSDESAQQLAFARIRAVELGRWVVNASTVGITAVISPTGEVVASLPWYEAGSIVAEVPLIDTITPAAAAGGQIEFALSGLGVALLLTRFSGAQRVRRGILPPTPAYT